MVSLAAMQRLARAAGPLAVVAAVLVQFRAVLAGRVFRFEDIAGYFEPLWTAAARAMAQGRLPLWDGGAWGGQPLVGDPQAGIFYPPNWLWLALPVLRAYAVLAAAHAAWAGLGMYALARVRGRSRAAAALAGIALAVGGYLVLQVRHIMFVEATAWLPWVAAAGLRLVETRAPRWLAATAAAGGMALLTGGVSMLYYGAWFVGALLLVAAARAPSRRGALVALAAAGALAAALAAPMLAPMLAHARLSPRALGADYHFASEGGWPHFGFLAALALPNPFGDDAAGTYVGGYVQWELAGYYAGMLPFALAAWWIARGDRQRRAERLVLGALLALAVLLARQGSLAHRVAYHVLPLLASTRCPARALYLFTLAVPLCAADGFDAVAARLPSRRRAVWSILGVALVAADLLVAHRHENPSLPLADAQAAGRPEALEYLAGQQRAGARLVNDVHLDHALHNAGLLWGRDAASGYSSLPLWRYLQFEWIANHGAPYPHERVHDDLSAQGLWRFSSPLVDALSVRWVLTAKPPNGPGYVRRYAGGDGVDVWENLHALPRAWLVGAARLVSDEKAAARAIAAPDFDPRALAVVEGAPSPAPEAADGTVDAIDLRAPTEVAIAATAARPTLLIFSQPYHPGWSATVDGAPAPLYPADLALQAVPLPAGRHAVVLRYRAPSVTAGLAVGGAALLALALLLTPWRRRARAAPR